MTHRARNSLKLAWNPLVFVLGQVVTSAVLRIEDYIPELQERFRKNGYPRFDRVESQAIRLGPKGGFDITHESRWIFSSKEATKSVVVSSGFVALEESEYVSFENFVEELYSTLTLFNEVVGAELYQRVGFRRINLLEDCERLPLDRIFKAGLLGLAGDVFAGQREQRVEHWGDSSVGRMMVRLLRPAPESVVSPDLEVSGLSVRQPRMSDWDTATLDIDHFAVRQHEFSPDSVVEDFWSLHDSSDLAFREAVTSEALETWEKGDPHGD